MKTILYYFTGTGNSLEIARSLAEKLPGAELRSLATAYRNGKLDIDAETIGFVFPVHYFGIPVALLRLLENTVWKKDTYTFAVANYGTMPGDALYQAERLIVKGGSKLHSGYLFHMPENYVPMFNVPKLEAQNRNFEALERGIPLIAADVIGRKAVGIEKSKLRIDRYLAGLAYPTVYKFKEQDKNFWVTDACNSCGICAQSCPFDNIKMAGKTPQWQHKCEMCMRCIHICPQKAIQYKKGTLKRARYTHPKVQLKDLMADGSAEK